MQSNFDAQQFADDVEEIAFRALSQPCGNIDLESARLVQQFSEETSQKHIGTDSVIVCRAGCAHCCIVNVAVLQPEADNIADYLFKTLSAEDLLDTYQYLRNLEKTTS